MPPRPTTGGRGPAPLFGDLGRAASYQEEAVQLAPDEREAWDNLGSIYQRKGRWREAMREYKEALRLEPHHRPALIALARLRAQMN